ncbi:hypothetical protein CPB86DRAFT_806033 [Serendipita vermifera]|nr:hypothetical protein CPB86DRAFT_806033 [Serendipita vermifera]
MTAEQAMKHPWIAQLEGTPTTRNVSVWLLPELKSSEFKSFDDIINSLAVKHGNHPFQPHVTLAMLPRDFPLVVLNKVVDEMKGDLFNCQVNFDFIFATSVGIAIQGAQEEPLMGLQQKFHHRLSEELTIWHSLSEDQRGDQKTYGYNIAQNIVPAFPHFSLAYTTVGQQEGVQELEEKGIYKRGDGSRGRLTIAGYEGYRIGAIFFAYCGGLKPEAWQIFKEISADGAAS